MPHEPATDDGDLPPDLPPDLMPAAFMSDPQRRRQPLGSPYAVPLTALTASAYVAVTDQVQEHPTGDGHHDLPGVAPIYAADDGS